MAGRKPVPTVLNLVRGNPGKRAPRAAEPTPPIGAAMPDWLSPDAAAHWPLVAKQLEDCGILTQIDAPALALYCEAFASWKHASEHVQSEGPVIKAPSGFPIQSPYLAIANKAFDQMRHMLVEFGMTPSSRTRVTRAPVEKPHAEKTGLAKFR